MKEREPHAFLHFCLWLTAGFLIGLPLLACHALSEGYAGFVKGWSEDPPPTGIPGAPFYLSPEFWYWAVGGTTTLLAAAKGTHVAVKRSRAKKVGPAKPA